MKPLPAVDVVVLTAGPNGLGAVRSLAQKGLRIGVIANGEGDPALYSRYPKFKLSLPNGPNKAEKLLAYLAQLDGFRPVLIPTSDWFVTFISEHKRTVEAACDICIPNDDIAAMLIDKAEETRRLADIVPLPKTVQQLPDSAAALLAALALPIIIKPRSHKHHVLGRKNIQLHNTEEAETFYEQFGAQREHLIAQEIIGGNDDDQYVCNCTFDHQGEMLQAFVFRRLRLSPAHYGVTSFAEGIASPQMIDLCRKLGRALHYTGPAMIEFMQKPQTGELQYIEINPRLGLCNWFDTCSGINNAYATYLLAKGDASELQGIRMISGKVFISLYEDTYSRRKDGETLKQIISSYVQRLRHPWVFPYFYYHDPMPALYMLTIQLKGFGGSVWKRLKRA